MPTSIAFQIISQAPFVSASPAIAIQPVDSVFFSGLETPENSEHDCRHKTRCSSSQQMASSADSSSAPAPSPPTAPAPSQSVRSWADALKQYSAQKKAPVAAKVGPPPTRRPPKSAESSQYNVLTHAYADPAQAKKADEVESRQLNAKIAKKTVSG